MEISYQMPKCVRFTNKNKEIVFCIQVKRSLFLAVVNITDVDSLPFRSDVVLSPDVVLSCLILQIMFPEPNISPGV